jgi:hypothetical protein
MNLQWTWRHFLGVHSKREICLFHVFSPSPHTLVRPEKTFYFCTSRKGNHDSWEV